MRGPGVTTSETSLQNNKRFGRNDDGSGEEDQ